MPELLEDEVAITVRRVPIDTWKELKIRAIHEGRTVQDLVIAALESYLKQAA